MKHKLYMLAGAASACLAFAPAMNAYAQTKASSDNGIAEVVVTASKTGATNLQKTPISVNVLGSDVLEKAHARNIKDLPALIPTLQLSIAGLGENLTVRGVGGNQGNESEVSIYVDGIFVNRSSIILETNFNDIDRVEVVEGPQGTLVGRNSTGGAINFISKAPSKTFSFENTLNVGNYSLLDEAARVSGPIADNVQASLSVSKYQHNGYVHNVYPGYPDAQAANRIGVRGQLRWEPTSNIDDTLRADYLYTHENFITTGVFILLPPPSGGVAAVTPLAASTFGHYHQVDLDNTPVATELSYGLSNELNWRLNDHWSLKSLTGYRSDHSIGVQDGDVSGISPNFNISTVNEYVLSQEFNLLHNYGAFSGVMGLYYYYEYSHFNYYGANPLYTLAGVNKGGTVNVQDTLQPTISRAAFIQETYHITPTLSLTAGVRYTQDVKNFNDFNSSLYLLPGNPLNGTTSPNTTAGPYTVIYPFVADLTKTASAATPKIAVEWQATPDAMFYASATNGFKAGGYNQGARLVLGSDFSPETIWAYEVGAKTDWFDHRLRANISYYHYNWKNLQFNSNIAPGFSSVLNAAAAVLDGVEMQFTAKPTDGLTLTANANFLASKYLSFPGGTIAGALKSYVLNSPLYNATTTNYNNTGNQMVWAPPMTINLTAEKDFDLSNGASLFVRGEYQYTAKTQMDPTNLPITQRPAFDLVNASMGYSPAGSHWTVALWGKNLADKQYLIGANLGSFVVGSAGDPRTFGVRINYTY